MVGGIFGSRVAKRQSRTQILQMAIGSNLQRANALRSAISSYGTALAAANRAGGFSPNAFSNSWSNLAADLRQIDYNQISQNQRALATASAGRMSLINGAIGAFSTLPGGFLRGRMTKIPAATPAISQSKFLDQNWLSQMSAPFGGPL
jgi:hypothetical protein